MEERTRNRGGGAVAVAGDRDRCLLEAMLGIPFTEGNAVEVLRNGDEAFPALLEAIGGAGRSIDLTWFLWGHGEITERIADALADRARHGVRVRVLLDAFGSKGILHDQVHRMRGAGATVLFHRPLLSWRPTTENLRNHQRVLVCDETLAFTGGTGIDRAWTGSGDRPAAWRDNFFRVRGPGVAGVRAAFAHAWLQAQVRLPGGLVDDEVDRFPELAPAGGSAVQVVHSRSQPGWTSAALAVAALLHTGRERVRIATPYARLPKWLHADLAALTARGVQVQLMVPGPHIDRRIIQMQSQHGFDDLLGAGVEIWQFQPTMLHTKTITVDGRRAMVGTVNVDTRSLSLNEQLALVVDDPALVGVLDGHYEEDLADSRRVVPEQWYARPLTRRLGESAANVAGRPLLGWGVTGLIGRRGWPAAAPDGSRR